MRNIKHKKLQLIHSSKAQRTDDPASITQEDIWDVVCNTPEEAQEMRQKTILMIGLMLAITKRGLTRVAAASLLGLHEEQLHQFLRGQFSEWSLADIERMVAIFTAKGEGNDANK